MFVCVCVCVCVEYSTDVLRAVHTVRAGTCVSVVVELIEINDDVQTDVSPLRTACERPLSATVHRVFPVSINATRTPTVDAALIPVTTPSQPLCEV